MIQANIKLGNAIRSAFPSMKDISHEMHNIVGEFFDNDQKIIRLKNLAYLSFEYDYDINDDSLIQKILDHAVEYDNPKTVESILSWYNRYILGEIPLENNAEFEESSFGQHLAKRRNLLMQCVQLLAFIIMILPYFIKMQIILEIMRPLPILLKN
jgi:hypothetical protein